MSFAILRISKLKTLGNIGGSLSHNYRTRETPNADLKLSAMNEHSIESAEKVKNAINARLPEKRRSDAVLCIEHLITASPEWSGWGTEKETEFFEKSKKWLEKKYGAQNVIATTIHRDETTPHLVAYVVPLDEQTGRLNAKKFIGGRVKLSVMQSDFAKEVQELGLERGIEGSKARHTTIKSHYSRINDAENAPKIDIKIPALPAADFFESKDKYAERVARFVCESLGDQIDPLLAQMNVMSSEYKVMRKELLEARRTVEAINKRAKPYFNAIEGLRGANGLETFNRNMVLMRKNMDEYADKVLRSREQDRKSEEEKENASKLAKEWRETFELMGKEQRESYIYIRDLTISRNKDDSMLEFELNTIKKRLIENRNYTVEDYFWRRKKREDREQEQDHKPAAVRRDLGDDFEFEIS